MTTYGQSPAMWIQAWTVCGQQPVRAQTRMDLGQKVSEER